MKISIFGLGYVGVVSAACLAESGNTVIGVDVNGQKVAQIADGDSPIVEKGLDEIIKENVTANRLVATTDAKFAVEESDLSIVCVGTPSLPNGNIDLSAVIQVCSELGEAIARKDDYHVVVLRSTLLPGSTEQQQEGGRIWGLC